MQADGSPVIDRATGQPRPRCCTQATKVFTREELALYQDVAFGEPDWFTKWNARDRIEGAFGSFKNLALVNWGHDYHHFVGLVRETSSPPLPWSRITSICSGPGGRSWP